MLYSYLKFLQENFQKSCDTGKYYKGLQNLLYTQRHKLSDLACKFLKFNTNIKSTSSNTYKSYAIDLKQFITHLQQFKSNSNIEYKDKDLRALHFSLKQWAHLQPSSRNRKYACIKAFLKWMHENSHLAKPLDHHVICPKVPKKTPHFLSLDEVISLLRHLKDQCNTNKEEKELSSHQYICKRNYMIVLITYSCALRVSEVSRLKWKDYRPSRSQLLIHGKGGKERLIVAPQIVKKELEQFEKKGPYIFSEKDTALNTRTIYEVVRQSGLSCGLLKPLNPHALRHSLATHLLSGGMNLRTLQSFLGHESLVATEKYTHLDIDKLGATLKKSHPLG